MGPHLPVDFPATLIVLQEDPNKDIATGYDGSSGEATTDRVEGKHLHADPLFNRDTFLPPDAYRFIDRRKG